MTWTRTIFRTLPLTLLTAAPLLAQQGPPPEAVERLDRIRLERMRHALALTEQEVTTLRSRIGEHRGEMREAMAAQRQAMERLHAALRAEPVEQGEVSRALEAVERQREAMAAIRDRHREAIGRDLSPEKRAKLMLFNERFDRRLRELMTRRRAPGMDRPMPGRVPGARGRAPRHRPGLAPRGDVDAEGIRRRIERLEAEIQRLRSRLDEIEG